MHIKKKCFLYIMAMSLPIIIFVAKAPTSYEQLIFYLDNQKHTLYYHPTQIYIDYKENTYDLLADKNKRFIDIAIGDIDSDGNDNLLVLEGEKAPYGDDLVIYDIVASADGFNIKERYRNKMIAVRPWKVETCDLDNDGDLDIFIAVNKATRYYKEIENRPFFFNFRNDILVKKWTGSKVRAPFTDVCFADLNGNGKDEFIVIEESEKGGFVVAVYYWFGFGFILQAESQSYECIEFAGIRQVGEEKFLEIDTKDRDVVRRIILEPSMKKTKNEIYLLKERKKAE